MCGTMIKFCLVFFLFVSVVSTNRAFLSFLTADHDVLMVRVLGQSIRDTNPNTTFLLWYSTSVSQAALDIVQTDGWTLSEKRDRWELDDITALGRSLDIEMLLFVNFDVLLLRNIDELWPQLMGEPEDVAFGAVNSFLSSDFFDMAVLLVNTTRTIDETKWKTLRLRYNAESTQSYLYPKEWAREEPISIMHYHNFWQPWSKCTCKTPYL